MPNLTNLDATWMNADLLESLVHLQKLERLSISRLQGSQSEDNEFFEPSFQGSKRIKELNMADSSQMTDSALVSITRTCQQIRVLIVSGNRCLTHEGLIQWCDQLFSPPLLPKTPAGEISDFVPMTELTTINFANCSRIQSIGFQALFERSRHLQHVNLMSTRVGDEALQVLAAKNQGLRTVVLNCCVAISDAGLQTLLRDCRKLRAVSFLYCNRITVRVFFQNLWRCLGLKELRFSLNGWHVDLIERGIEGPTPEVEVNPSVILQHEDGFQGITAPQSHYYEPHLEFMIFGKPELDDTTDHHTLTQGLEPEDSFSSMQEYRQRLILSRMYGQIERLCQLEILDMRNTHLPFDLASGLCRLGRLEKLQILEWTGLEQPLGPPEITWLTGTVNKAAPLPSLHQLVFKGGYSMSKELLRKLKDHRPNLEVQLTQLLDHS
ncbi:hypothetical protein EDD21DRAFT_360926 [Dissophora ornata]|nr:hypothetical protein EDD21DRAFT_360926 [Dissophora ornata]